MTKTQKIKSLCAVLINSVEYAVKELDNQVEKLGTIEIHGVTDTVYPNKFNEGDLIVRVVVYTLI